MSPASRVAVAVSASAKRHTRHNGARLICDGAQFYQPEQVEQMADLVDDADIDVYAFGLATDFRSCLFPAVKRLFELADEVVRLQVEVLCWCGRQGHLNARVESGRVVREGVQAVIGDTAAAQLRYQVLCRRHYRTGDLGPTTPAVGQLELSRATTPDVL